MALLWQGVPALLPQATPGAPCLSRLATEVSEVQKTELYAAVLSFALEASGQHLDWESKRQQQLYQR